LEPPLCVVSSWAIKKIYIILIWNIISGSSNLDNCFYYCLIFTLILHLEILFNSSSSLSSSSSSSLLLLLLLLLFIIYTVNLLVIRRRSCRVIYYFDTPTLGRKHQSFGRVTGRPSIFIFKSNKPVSQPHPSSTRAWHIVTPHTGTPNLQSPDLANQSPPSLTTDLKSCHNSHQVWVLFFCQSLFLFFFNICYVIYIFVGISL